MLNRVGEFEKVSYEQFYNAMTDEIYKKFAEQLSASDKKNIAEFIKDMHDNICIPTRSTSGSAGYDFKAPFAFSLAPGATIKIPTGIRVKIDEGWWLGCLPRSGHGFKYRIQLDNTMGVVDSDYYYSDNEGHIFLKLTNDNYQKKTFIVDSGDKIAQGIFLPYGITYTDNVKTERNGGFGSTGR